MREAARKWKKKNGLKYMGGGVQRAKNNGTKKGLQKTLHHSDIQFVEQLLKEMQGN